ncbi:MAG TPA: hypothetical protein VGZ22_22960 [Isosphaeraceae bacterium]|jgi:hypothetical protein|nr:hypothetical protein [Isosphaeraceae bacterium]
MTLPEWLASGTPAAVMLVIILGLGIVSLFVVAFMQDRPITFWPPKIGSRPVGQTSGLSKSSLAGSTTVRITGLAKVRIPDFIKKMDDLCLKAVDFHVVSGESNARYMMEFQENDRIIHWLMRFDMEHNEFTETDREKTLADFERRKHETYTTGMKKLHAALWVKF